MLTGLVWGWSVEGITDEQISTLNLNAEDHRLKLTLELARQLIGTPRHLSQHPGGFVLTQERLDDLVPIEPARMDDRPIIEWEKNGRAPAWNHVTNAHLVSCRRLETQP